MPVDFNKLSLAPINACVVAEETASLWQIYAMLPPKRDDRLYRFVVTPLADGTFIVARWIEVEEIVHRLLRYDDVRDWTLVDLANYEPPPDYVEPDDHIAAKLATIPLANLIQRLKPASALDRQAHTTHQARTARDSHPGRRVVVLDNGVIYGIVFEEELTAGDLAADPFAQSIARLAAPSNEPTYLPETADMIYAEVAPSASSVDDVRGATADVSEPERPASALLNTISHSGSQDDRVFNLWIEQRLVQEAEIVGGGRTLTRIVPPNEALSIGGMYTVNVNVAAPLASARVRSRGVKQAEEMTTATQIEVDVRLVADGGYFKVYGIPQQKIIFPRGGVSKNLASFTIEPLKQGIGEITAILSLNQKPFQKIVAQVAIGDTALAALPAEPVRASGLTLAAAATTMSNPRAYPPETDASLVIIRETTGYTFFLSLGSGYSRWSRE